MAASELQRTFYASSIAAFVSAWPGGAAALSRGLRLVLTDSGQVVRWVPGVDLEYPGRSDGADGLFVDERWYRDPDDRCGNLLDVETVYDGGAAVGANPNSDWLWSTVTGGTGTVSVVGSYTRCNAPAAGDDAYLQVSGGIAGQAANTYMILPELRVVSADGNDPRCEYNNSVSQGGAGSSPIVWFGNPGAGDVTFQFGGPGYGFGANTWFGLTFDFFDLPTLTVREYDTGMVVATTITASEGVSGADRIRIGCRVVGAACELHIGGFPGIALFSV